MQCNQHAYACVCMYLCIYVPICLSIYLSTYCKCAKMYIYIHVGQIEVIPQHMFTAVLLVATGRFTGGNDMHHTCVSLKLKLWKGLVPVPVCLEFASLREARSNSDAMIHHILKMIFTYPKWYICSVIHFVSTKVLFASSLLAPASPGQVLVLMIPRSIRCSWAFPGGKR